MKLTNKKLTRVFLAAAITTASGLGLAPGAWAEPTAETQPAGAAPGGTPATATAGDAFGTAVEIPAPVAPTKSIAKSKSEIEVGIGKTSADSYKYGDYKGLDKSKPYLITNLLMSRRGEDNASYLELSGRNLGLDSRNIKIRGGKQGDYGMRLEYDELTRLLSDSYQTPYSGMGSSVLARPTTWTIDAVPSTPLIDPIPNGSTNVTTAMMADLAANMKSFNVQTRRKALALSVNKTLPDGWYAAASFKREKKDGTRLTGAVMQIGGQGNRGAVIIPEPINYNTDQFEVSMRRASEKLHLQFGYYASLFSNANQSTTFDNLFQNTITGVGAVGGNALTGRLGQMPDNQLHQLNISGGYTLTDATRLTGSLSRGRMTQNQAFLPYATVLDTETTISTATTPALPANSLNGRIDITHADLKLNSRLTRELNLSAGYKYDDRHNRTAANEYTYQTADNTLAAGGATAPNLALGNSQNIRRNTPLSNTKKVLYADLDYRLTAVTKLKLGYDYEKVVHTYEPTQGDREHTVKAEVKHNFSDTASAGMGLARAGRKTSSPYNGAGGLQDTYTAAYLASLCVSPNQFLYNGVLKNCTGTASATSTATVPFLDTPALLKYSMSNRKRDKLHVFANAAATDKLDLQFDANYSYDKYPDAIAGFGLTRAINWAANFEASLAATDTVSGKFYSTVENYKTNQNSHNRSSCAAAGSAGSCAAGTDITTLDRQNNTAAFDPLTGTINRSDRSVTMGLGFKVKPGGSYDWGGDLTHTTTTGSTSFSDIGSRLLNILPLPDVVTRLSRLEVFGKYQLQKDMALNMRYAYEKYASKDWAWDGQTIASSTQIVGTAQTSPRYNIHMINVSLSYVF